MKRSQEKTKPMPQFMQRGKQKSQNHRRSTSNRYTEEKESNSDERALVSPVEEKTIPQPTEEVSQKCFQLAKQLDFLEAFTKSIEISKEKFSETEIPQKENSDRKELSSSKIFAWGNNSSAQICTTEGFIHDPVQISLSQIKAFKQVSCGHSHTLMLSEQGIVFAMGNNNKYQLGLCADIIISKDPSRVDGFNQVVQIACGDFNSYAIDEKSLFAWGSCQALGIDQQENSWKPMRLNFQNTKTQIKSVSGGNNHAAALSKSNELFVWGSNSYGQLALADKVNRKIPTSCADFNQLQVTQVSCGRDYTFVITENNEMLVSGKLPFTIEHMQVDKSVQTDFLTTFQSVAQFETGVKVVQIETSKFASILVKPGNSAEPKELFMWGETPLGLFQEPTSLNQLISECQDGGSQVFDVKAVKNGQHFCVFVDETTGLTYQLGAEDLGDPLSSESQVTLSELRDARFNDQNQFACGSDFIIGSSIQETSAAQSPPSLIKKSPLKKSPLKPFQKQNEDLSCGLQCITEEQNLSIQSSTSKKIRLVKIVETEHSAESGKSLARDVQVMITPNKLPDKQALDKIVSEQSQMGLTGEIFREYLKPSEPTPSQQTSPEKSIKTRVPSLNLAEQVSQAQVKSEHAKQIQTRTETRARSKSNQKLQELAFNNKSPAKKSPQKTSQNKNKPPVAYKREASCDEDKMVTARESHSIGSNNPKVTPRNRLAQDAHHSSNQSLGQFKTAKDEFKHQLSDRQGHEIRQLDYSPGVSPIQKYSQIRDSLADMASAMGMFSQQDDRSMFDTGRMHCRIPSEISASAFQNNDAIHAYGCKQIVADQNYISSHGPKQQDMQIQFSSNQQSFKNQSPIHILNQQQKTPRSSRYQGIQQNTQLIQQLASNGSHSPLNYLPSGPNTTGQKAQEYVVRTTHVQPTNLNTVFQSFTDNMSMSNMRASYCGPFAPANLDSSIHLLELEGMLVKEKVEILEHHLRDEKSKRLGLEQTHRQDLEATRSQIQDLMKQLEKAGKDYSKLLSQVDEDQEETAQLREKDRSQTNQISSLSEKLRYQDEERREWLKIKEKLENEIKDTLNALKQSEELAKINTLNNSTMIQTHCQNEKCEQRISELEEQLFKKTLMVQDLAKRLGSIEFENKEIRAELRDRTEALQERLDKFKDIAQQESNQDNDRIIQLQDLVEKLQSENCTLKQANAQVQEPKVLSKTAHSPSPIAEVKPDNRKVKASPLNKVTKTETELFEFKTTEAQIAKEKKRNNNFHHEPSQSHFTQFTSIGEAYSENIQDPIKQSFQYFDKNIFQNKHLNQIGGQNVSPKPDLDESAYQKMFDQSQNETITDHHRQISTLQAPKDFKQPAERSGSRLKQPTPIQKSSPLKATLERMNKVVYHKPQISTRTQQARNPSEGLTKNRSVADLPASDAISKGKNYHKQCSQSNLSMEIVKRKKASQSFNAGRHSFVQGKSTPTLVIDKATPTPRNAVPKQTPVIQQNAGISATPRSGVIGPPMNLENRYASKSSRNIETNPEVSTIQNRSPWRHQQCETQRVTYDSKRNNLISKYKTSGKMNQDDSSLQNHTRNESEQQIDIKLAGSISVSNTNKNQNFDFIENDFNSQQVQQFKPRKSILLESYEQNTPKNKTVLSNDSTNGLSTMKDKLKSIQDNKQMLEKKILEYERKLQQIQKKSKLPNKMR